LEEGVLPHGANGISCPDALWSITPSFRTGFLSNGPVQKQKTNGSLSQIVSKLNF